MNAVHSTTNILWPLGVLYLYYLLALLINSALPSTVFTDQLPSIYWPTFHQFTHNLLVSFFPTKSLFYWQVPSPLLPPWTPGCILCLWYLYKHSYCILGKVKCLHYRNLWETYLIGNDLFRSTKQNVASIHPPTDAHGQNLLLHSIELKHHIRKMMLMKLAAQHQQAGGNVSWENLVTLFLFSYTLQCTNKVQYTANLNLKVFLDLFCFSQKNDNLPQLPTPPPPPKKYCSKKGIYISPNQHGFLSKPSETDEKR